MWLLWTLWAGAWAQPAADTEEHVVEAGRRSGADGSRTLDRAAVEALPARSADDLLRALPGLHLSSHGGRGKAYQFLLRGFDAGHGADLAVDLEGVPLNEPSNLHAHGYLDLHFLPTVLVEGLAVHPGAWRPEVGPFGVAGSASYRLGLEEPVVRLGIGSDLSAELGVAWRPEQASPRHFLLAEVDGGRGIGMARSWRNLRMGAGAEARHGPTLVRAWVLAHDGRFESPGVLREADVDGGVVGFWDAYAGSGGGRSSRLLAAGSVSGGGPGLPWKLMVHGGWRRFATRQNFTGWYVDPEHGDGSLQEHESRTLGGRATAAWIASRRAHLSLGLDVRVDSVDRRESLVDPDGSVRELHDASEGVLAATGAWWTADLRPSDAIRVVPGLRADLAGLAMHGQEPVRSIVPAPRLAVYLFEDRPVGAFVGAGRGHRPPDASTGRTSVADSAEFALILQPTPALRVRGAAFGSVVSEELLFDPLNARWLPAGRTLRRGLQAALAWQPVTGLRFDADVGTTDARHFHTGDRVPYTPRSLAVASATLDRLRFRELRVTAAVRGWWLGPRPLPYGFSSRPTGSVDLVAAARWEAWRLALDIDNLLGRRWRDGEFVFPSRWTQHEPRSGLPVRHFTAGAPPAARLTLERSL